MAASETDIVNSALIKVGAETILSLDQNSPQARIMKEQYSKVLADLLRSHPWNFAIKRVSLAASTEAPAYKFTYKFVLPSDCLRVLETDFGSMGGEWQREGNFIVTDSDTLYMRYVSSDVPVGRFDANFVEAFATRLAADVAYKFTQNASLTELLMKEAEQKLRTARSFDAQEGGTRQVYARQWLNARY